MRLRRIEFIAIALTFAFICFMGGYFAGSRGAVNIVTAGSQYGETRQTEVGDVPNVPASVGGNPTTINTADESNGTVQDTGEGSPSIEVQSGGGEALGTPRGGDGRININTASRSELMDLPGIGTTLAGRIVDYRNQHGAFFSIDEIKRVSGIGEKRFEAIMDKITVG